MFLRLLISDIVERRGEGVNFFTITKILLIL